jgi:hypothetical protein
MTRQNLFVSFAGLVVMVALFALTIVGANTWQNTGGEHTLVTQWYITTSGGEQRGVSDSYGCRQENDVLENGSVCHMLDAEKVTYSVPARTFAVLWNMMWVIIIAGLAVFVLASIVRPKFNFTNAVAIGV